MRSHSAQRSVKPRRQARGQQRIAQLLQAAGEVFAEVGYEQATTNAIAARAGVSPGSLYQFFSSKQAMAEALAADYAERSKSAHDLSLLPRDRNLSLPELLDRLVDPLLAFRRSAPGFDALLSGSVVSAELAGHIKKLHDQMEHQLIDLLRHLSPQLSLAAARRHARICFQVFKGMMPPALNGSDAQRRRGTRELKEVLRRYLAPMVDDPG